MVKIIDKLLKPNRQEPYFSYEFFPPKTDMGVENLYSRIERMTSYGPIFVDVTWGAGGCTRDVTMAICEYVQMYLGVDVLMHLTCTNMSIEDLKNVLVAAKNAGIHNILVLRGDPPMGHSRWEPHQSGFTHAVDLVRFIRTEFGDYFCIAVAGFPEGHPASLDHTFEISHLKEKIAAGADFVLTQFFYDVDKFLQYNKQCRQQGITCPIIPGMMPIQSYSSLQKMISYSRIEVPDFIWASILPIKNNDEEVKALGVRVCSDMCQKLHDAGIPGFHFYTMNLEKSVLQVLQELGLAGSASKRRALPWRGSRSTIQGKEETVRPINWANRPKSYIQRTESWDEFPNGRWGNPRSPAFGELSDLHFFKPSYAIDSVTNGQSSSEKVSPQLHQSLSNSSKLIMWGEVHMDFEDIYEVFAKYVEGKIPSLPWCELSLQSETLTISPKLAELNRAGLLSINSQPAVNGEKSDHPVFGWGGSDGYVYQKAYVEFFVSPELLDIIVAVVKKRENLNLYAVNSSRTRDIIPYEMEAGVTALTWGVFKNKEIQQPTVFTWQAFTVWSEEAFQLWLKPWAALYDDETTSSALLYEVHDNFFLVAIIDNDFMESEIFAALDEVVQIVKSKK